MGAIHELREDYRHFRGEHPQLRGLFLLGDLVGLLIKLALFGGFLFVCWYIVSRSPYNQQTVTPPAAVIEPVAEQTLEAVPDSSSELSEERIALLREIAGQNGNEPVNSETLLGSVSADSESPDSRGLIGSAVADARGTQSNNQQAIGPVKVESLPGIGVFAGYEPPNDTAAPVPDNSPTGQTPAKSSNEFADEIFDVNGELENGLWVLARDSSYFTMQLALTVNVEFLVDYAKKLPAEYTAAIFPERRNRNGNIQYSLSLGSFPTSGSAEAALADLPSDLRRYGAHVRKFDEAQANASTFLQ